MSVTVNNRFQILLDKKSKKEGREISLAEVAEATGISRQALYKWKNNTLDRFENKTINLLCQYFAIDPGQLFEYVPD